MIGKAFFDTNIFVYAYTFNDERKHNAIIELFVKEHSEVVGYIMDISNNFSVFGVTKNTSLYALSLKEKYGYSWWDSLILASALENDCQVVYSEDMQHNQTIENTLRIVNPFLG